MKTGIVGLGVTGQSVLRWLAPRDEVVWAWDTRAGFDLGALQAAWPEVRFHRGAELPPDWWHEVEQVVVSPGIAVSDPVLAPARRLGLPLIGDVELFARAVRRPVIAITGTNGKSTVTTLTAELLRAGGRMAVAGGNLGTPALDLLAQSSEAEIFVLELSSFQLETLYSLTPAVATVLNISEDHMDRYASMADYAAAKRRILRGTRRQVLPDALTDWADPGVPLVRFGLRQPEADTDWGVCEGWLCVGRRPVFPLAQLPDTTQHRLLNTLAALALAAPFLPDVASAASRVLPTFHGLAHRTERVPTADGILWINDSKGTNVGATQAALESFHRQGRVILLLGGVGKGQDFTPLAHQAMRQAAAVVVFGEAGPELAGLLQAHPRMRRVETLAEALAQAQAWAEPGDVVLFSPACASFDQFEHYRARGEAFRAWVKEHVSGDDAADTG